MSEDRIDIFETDRDTLDKEWGGGLDDVFYVMGLFLDRPVVDEVARRPENGVCCRYDVRRLNKLRTLGPADEAARSGICIWKLSPVVEDGHIREVRVVYVPICEG